MRATTTTSDYAVYDALLHRVSRELEDMQRQKPIYEQVEELLATGREIGQKVSLRREPRSVGVIGLPPGARLYTDEDQLDDLVADEIANWHRDHHTKEN